MEQKTSAHYQRLHRQRLREQGLVKKEVWILPEYGAALQQLEKQMRVPGLQPESNFPINHGSAQGRTASGAVQGCEGTAQWPLSQADPALGCPAHATETSACPPSGSHFARQSQPPS